MQYIILHIVYTHTDKYLMSQCFSQERIFPATGKAGKYIYGYLEPWNTITIML